MRPRLMVAFVGLALVAACRPGTSPPRSGTALHRTDPKTWSTGGWQEFHWGMGPGDVELLLRNPGGDLKAFRTQELPPSSEPLPGSADDRWVHLTEGHIEIAGRDCTLSLGFHRGELFQVALTSQFNGGLEQTLERRLAWRDEVARLLRGRHGSPSKTDETPLWRTMVWEADVTSITLVMLEVGDGIKNVVPVDILYEDPVRKRLSLHPAPDDGK